MMRDLASKQRDSALEVHLSLVSDYVKFFHWSTMPGTIHDPIGGQSRATIAAKQAKPLLGPSRTN